MSKPKPCICHSPQPFFPALFPSFQITIAAFSSGLEISMCSEAIFGNDVDVLSWDYGMIDEGRVANLLHYFYRASLSPGRPVLLGMSLGGLYLYARLEQMMSLEKMGMSAFWVNTTTNTAMYEAIPDTLGMAEDDINAMGDMVRNLKCSGQIEKGEPYCSQEKYNMFACPSRRGCASWHPG
jgi:hypothetical protein